MFCVVFVKELAGYTGGDASFLKEDFEIQLNKTLFWDSVRFYIFHFIILEIISSMGIKCGLTLSSFHLAKVENRG